MVSTRRLTLLNMRRFRSFLQHDDDDEESFDFDYEDEDEEEPDAGLENKYYNAKGELFQVEQCLAALVLTFLPRSQGGRS